MNCKKTLFTISCLLIVWGGVQGATVYVPDDYPAIQDAINACASGDTIIVRPGTYYENIDFLGKALTVRSESGPQATIIDGNQSGSVVTFVSGEGLDSVLDGFTVTNGTGTDDGGSTRGGGVYCTNGSSPTVSNNIITSNTADKGGGIYPYGYGCNALITDNVISYNHANSNGGGVRLSVSAPVVANNIIEYNSTDGEGGGIIASTGCTPTIENNIIRFNTAVNFGAGVEFVNDCDLSITNNIISENVSQNGGGGVVIAFDCTGILANNIISQNSADYAAGFYCSEIYSLALSGNTISGNSAASFGGGMYCLDSSMLITANRFEENLAGSAGGGVFSWNNDVSSFVGNIFCNNTVTQPGSWGGGGFTGYQSYTTLVNNIMFRNTAEAGGAITVGDYCNMTLTNNTIFDNYAVWGGAIYCFASNPTITNTIFWNNDAPYGPEICLAQGSDPVVTYCDVKGGWPGTGNIDADPLFADWSNDDFHLTWDSPCRNTGDSYAVKESYDFEGDPRYWDGSTDIGADEYYTHLYHVGSVVPGGSIDVKIISDPNTGPITLALGSGVQDPPRPTPYGDLYLVLPPLKTFKLGFIPSNGVRVLSSAVPSTWQTGEQHPLQALVGPLGYPGSMLTNLMLLTVQ